MAAECAVALLAEGVDRNANSAIIIIVAAVALLAEGVDRNVRCRWRRWPSNLSPSSRRAWIEMYQSNNSYNNNQVALLAEGVDRNYLHSYS